MAQADFRGPDTADSLERFEPLLLRGQQQLDAPSNL